MTRDTGASVPLMASFSPCIPSKSEIRAAAAYRGVKPGQELPLQWSKGQPQVRDSSIKISLFCTKALLLKIIPYIPAVPLA